MPIIIVGGGPATGKSSIVGRLARDLGLRTFVKDEVKEQQYLPLDIIRRTARWFQLERRSWDTLYKTVEEAVATGESVIVEGNFLAPQRRALRELVPMDADVREVFCRLSGLEALRRFAIRAEDDQRHPVHQDRLWYGVVALGALSARLGLPWHRPLLLTGTCLVVDTTFLDDSSYAAVLRYVRSPPTTHHRYEPDHGS